MNRVANYSLTNSERRNRSIDISRGIAILAIITGHFGIFSITRVVYTFHVPIFLIITGYFMREGKVLSYVRKRVKTLLCPYIITCLVIILLAGVLAVICNGDVIKITKSWMIAGIYGAGTSYNLPVGIAPIGAIWFLWAVFWAGLFLQLSLNWKPSFRFLWVILLFVIGYYTAHHLFWFPFSIQAGCCGALYVYVGYCVKQNTEKLRRLPNTLKIIYVVIAFGGWLIFITTFRSFSLVRCDFGRGFFDIMGSLCACLGVYMISTGINRYIPQGAEILAFFGRNSLFMLCAHVTEMNLIDWWKVVDILDGLTIPHIISCGIAVGIKLLFIVGTTWILTFAKNLRQKKSN